jgi:CheY-like chemotaxis protein
VLKRYLSTLNVEVDEAADGEEAIQKVLENGEYSIIWMDVRLGTGKMSGPTCAKQLRQLHEYSGCIAAITGTLHS